MGLQKLLVVPHVEAVADSKVGDGVPFGHRCDRSEVRELSKVSLDLWRDLCLKTRMVTKRVEFESGLLSNSHCLQL